jgi:hypothetical protein
VGTTPEFATATYHYHVTAAAPYISGCFRETAGTVWVARMYSLTVFLKSACVIVLARVVQSHHRPRGGGLVEATGPGVLHTGGTWAGEWRPCERALLERDSWATF